MEVSSKSDRKFDRQNPAQGVADSFSLPQKKSSDDLFRAPFAQGL